MLYFCFLPLAHVTRLLDVTNFRWGGEGWATSPWNEKPWGRIVLKRQWPPYMNHLVPIPSGIIWLFSAHQAKLLRCRLHSYFDKPVGYCRYWDGKRQWSRRWMFFFFFTLRIIFLVFRATWWFCSTRSSVIPFSLFFISVDFVINPDDKVQPLISNSPVMLYCLLSFLMISLCL